MILFGSSVAYFLANKNPLFVGVGEAVAFGCVFL